MPLSTSDISLRWVLGSEGMAVDSRLILYNLCDCNRYRDFLQCCLVSHSRRLLTGHCMTDATALSSPAGNRSSEPNPGGTLRTKECVMRHGAFVLGMGSQTQNIELGPGPAQS